MGDEVGRRVGCRRWGPGISLCLGERERGWLAQGVSRVTPWAALCAERPSEVLVGLGDKHRETNREHTGGRWEARCWYSQLVTTKGVEHKTHHRTVETGALLDQLVLLLKGSC